MVVKRRNIAHPLEVEEEILVDQDEQLELVKSMEDRNMFIYGMSSKCVLGLCLGGIFIEYLVFHSLLSFISILSTALHSHTPTHHTKYLSISLNLLSALTSLFSSGEFLSSDTLWLFLRLFLCWASITLHSDFEQTKKDIQLLDQSRYEYRSV